MKLCRGHFDPGQSECTTCSDKEKCAYATAVSGALVKAPPEPNGHIPVEPPHFQMSIPDNPVRLHRINDRGKDGKVHCYRCGWGEP